MSACTENQKLFPNIFRMSVCVWIPSNVERNEKNGQDELNCSGQKKKRKKERMIMKFATRINDFV